MADTLTAVTNFINSPPTQVVAGGALGGIVWRSMERIEALLTDKSKSELSRWLVGLSVKNKDRTPRRTLGRLVLVIFSNDTSLLVAAAILAAVSLLAVDWSIISLGRVLYVYGMTMVADSCWLMTIRDISARRTGQTYVSPHGQRWVIGIVIGVCLFFLRVSTIDQLFASLSASFIELSVLLFILLLAAWIVRVTQHFLTGFRWFNSKLDVEKKPLQSIGLVAGALVAVVYWGVVGGVTLVQHFKH
jgi:hypothetical protein